MASFFSSTAYTHLPQSYPSSFASSLPFSSTKSSFLNSASLSKISDQLHPLCKNTATNQNHVPIQMSWGGPLSSVKFILQGKDIKLSDFVKHHVEDKVGKAIQKHSHFVRGVDVRVSGRVGKHLKLSRTEVTIFTKKHAVIRVEKDGETIQTSIDMVCSVIKRELRKVKEKDSDHGRHMKGFDRRNVRDPQILLDQEWDAVDQEEDT